MGRVTVKEIAEVLVTICLANLLFSLILFPWITDDDISNLPKEPLDRFITLYYFGIAAFTTTGFGDVVAKSSRVKIIVTVYILLAISGAASFFFNF